MEPPPSPSSSSIHSTQSYKLRADSVSAHPLLGTSSDAVEASSFSSIPVRYKPRQRVSEPQPTTSVAASEANGPSVASLSTSKSSVSEPAAAAPEGSPSQATFKLQTQSLQAVAQSELGLSNESVGWAILQRLISQPAARQTDRLWADLLVALGSGKVALLLPKEPMPPSEVVTAGLLADHCIILETGVANLNRSIDTCFATLSGLRGGLSVSKEQLAFASMVPIPDEADAPTLFASDDLRRSLLGEPTRRPEVPLPQRATKYTSFAIKPSSVTLSIPQQPVAAAAKSASISKGVPSGSTTSKLASLFGSKGAPAAPQAVEADSASSPASIAPLAVSAFAVDRAVRRPDVAKGISRAAEARVRHLFGERWPRAAHGIRKAAWDDIVERCIGILNAFQPPKLSNWSSEGKGKASLYHAGPEGVAAALQDLYEQVTLALSGSTARRRPSIANLTEEKEADTNDNATAISDEEADSVLEAVEDIIATELYDRLFCPSVSQDAVDDENLAARIAGLNLLEISLDHLGLAIEAEDGEADEEKEQIREGLAALTTACGHELRRLQDPLNTSPRQKLEVLVAAHKLIVERIALLPPIPQKEDTSASTPVPGGQQEIELSDDKKHLNSSRSAQTDLTESTPRPSSRPPSISDAALPEIKLPEAAVVESHYFDEHAPGKRRKSTSGADVILPILIWCILQANPQRLVSDLLYIERFHAGGLLGGESGYCLVNFQAVLEFLLHVDLRALGLGADSDRLLARIPSLTPTPAADANALRNRVSSEVASLALAAGKGLVGIGGAVEDGYRMLGGLLARSTASLDAARQPQAIEGVRSVLDTASPATSPTIVARQPLLRRTSTPLFGKNGDAAAARNRSKSDAMQRELEEVSPAGSVDPPSSPTMHTHDIETRGARSFSSLLGAADRPSLGDRLASLARFASPDKPGTPKPSSRPSSIISASPLQASGSQEEHDGIEAPPIERFLTCSEADLRVGEISALLQDYRRLASALVKRGLAAPVGGTAT